MTETPVPARPRTAHNHRQLAEALGWELVQVAKAALLGVLPPYDLKTPRWKALTVDELVTRRDELAAALDETALLTTNEIMTHLGLDYGSWKRGFDAGVFPKPDCGDYWSRAIADDLLARLDQLREEIPPPPLGARKCADLLAELTGLAAAYEDIETLAKEGIITIGGEFKLNYKQIYDLYDIPPIRAIPDDPDKKQRLAEIIAEREAWLANSATHQEALALLDGWTEHDFRDAMRTQKTTPGRFRRWPLDAVVALTADTALVDTVRRDKLLWPVDAAAFLGIRKTDFGYAVGARLIRAADATIWEPSWGRRKVSFTVDLYRRGDLEDLAAWPGIDWPAARALDKGAPSPFAPIAARLRRIDAVRQELASRYSVLAKIRFRPLEGVWQISWTPSATGKPDLDDATEILDRHRTQLGHTEDIELAEPAE